MSRVAYVNGSYVPHREAAVHVEDRGYQFADGVYEVIAVWNGLPVDFGLHLKRLETGLAALRIPVPTSRGALIAVSKQMLRRNRIKNGIIYWQVTRGVAPRNHPYPTVDSPSVVMTARSGLGPKPRLVEEGVSVISVPEIRWQRRDIKSVSLLPNVMAKQQAVEAGAFEAWQVEDDGTVTEGSSTNAWIVDNDGRLVTCPLGESILAGITRHVLIELAAKAGIEVVERQFSLEEAKGAREALLSSTTSFVLPIVDIDGTPVGNGHPGSVARRLRDLYMDHLDTLTSQTAWE